MADTDSASALPSGSVSPKEDAATKSAREELKHTVISEKQRTGDRDSKRRGVTPENATLLEPGHHDVLKEQVSSPKKKRAHDEVDDDDDNETEGKKKNKDEQSSDDADSATAHSSTSALDPPNGSGTRAEPEKKRLRDEATEDASPKDAKPSEAKTTADDSSPVSPIVNKKGKPAAGAAPASSSPAFTSSGFANLTSSSSPFGALGGASVSAKPSLFGSTSSSASPFGALGGAGASVAKPPASSTSPALASPPTLSFGGGSASPFASLQGSTTSSKVFGSSFGGSSGGSGGFGSIGGGFGGGSGSTKVAFGSALSGSGLTSFATPGEAFKSDKRVRPFGAPESDAEDSGDEDSAAEEDENGDEGEGDEEGGEAEERSKAGAEEKKKQRLQRVAVDDGEAGEATLLQVRARMYYLDKDLGGWKERGAGMLKVNVPEHCIEFDRDGSVIPASFDASTLGVDEDESDEAASEDAESKSETGSPKAKSGTGVAALPKRSVVRLIMRQDSTHRVILNTAVLVSTEFKERQTLKATTVLFTAFEGDDAKPVSVQAKMNIPNAKTFMSVMEGIQKELRGD